MLDNETEKEFDLSSSYFPMRLPNKLLVLLFNPLSRTAKIKQNCLQLF